MAPLPSWVLFGDSITQYGFNRDGWGAGLAELYERKADIVNRGHGGFNTRWALEIFDPLFAHLKGDPPALVTIFFGANDAAIADRSSALQHVPVAEYATNLRALIDRFRALGVRRIAVIGPPPVDEPTRVTYALEAKGVVIDRPERLNAVAGEYSATAAQVARGAGVPYIELWERFQAVEGWQKALLSDGLHLTARGNDLVLDGVLTTVAAEWPEITPDATLFHIPSYAAFYEHEDPINTLRQLLQK